jgi:hypothetical protein
VEHGAQHRAETHCDFCAVWRREFSDPRRQSLVERRHLSDPDNAPVRQAAEPELEIGTSSSQLSLAALVIISTHKMANPSVAAGAAMTSAARCRVAAYRRRQNRRERYPRKRWRRSARRSSEIAEGDFRDTLPYHETQLAMPTVRQKAYGG